MPSKKYIFDILKKFNCIKSINNIEIEKSILKKDFIENYKQNVIYK
tara:strand:+ start:191 stop:328 length:138 start_codon:yes stop_codon:yes gene_type:complete